MTAAVARQCLWLVPRFLLAWLVYLVAVEVLLSLGAGVGFGRQLISLGPTGFFADAPNSIESQAGTPSAAWGSVLFQATVASMELSDILMLDHPQGTSAVRRL